MEVEQQQKKKKKKRSSSRGGDGGGENNSGRKQLCVSLDDREREVFQRALAIEEHRHHKDMFDGDPSLVVVDDDPLVNREHGNEEKISQLTAMITMLQDERNANVSYQAIARQACTVLGVICAHIASVSDVDEAEDDDMVKQTQLCLHDFGLATDDCGEGLGEQECASVTRAIGTAELIFKSFMENVVPLATKSMELQANLDHMTQRYEERGDKLREGSASFQKMLAQHEKLVEYSKETEALNHALEDKQAHDKMLRDAESKLQNNYFNIMRERNTQIANQLQTKQEECALATSVCETLTMENIRLREMVDTLEHKMADVTRKLGEWSRSQRLPTPEDVCHMKQRKLLKRAYAVLSAKHEVAELELMQTQHAFQAETKRIEDQFREKELQLMEVHQQRLADVERRQSKINSDRASLGEERRTLAAKVDSMRSEIDILKKDNLRLQTECSAAASAPPPCTHTADELFHADLTLQLVGHMCRGANSSSSSGGGAVEPAKQLAALISTLSQKRADNKLRRGNAQPQDTRADYKAVNTCLRENVVALVEYAKRVRLPSVSASRKDSDGLVILGKLCVDLIPYMLSMLQGCCKGSWRTGVEHEWIKQQLPRAEALCTTIVAAYKTESVTMADATQLRTCMMQEIPSSKDPPDSVPPPRRHRLMQWVAFHAATCMDMNDHFAMIEKKKTAKALEHMQTLHSKLFESTGKRITELVSALTSNPGAFPLFTTEGEDMVREMDADLKTLDTRVSLIVAEALVPLDIKHVLTSYQSAWKFLTALVEKLRADPQLNPPPRAPSPYLASSSPMWDPTKN